MDPAIALLILQDRKIAYVITDAQLQTIQVGGDVNVFPTLQACEGLALLTCFPELVGSEDLLQRILAGDLARFQLAWVNRETPQGQTVYWTMTTLPHRDQNGQIKGVVQAVEDVTEVVALEQQSAQRRNELRLLQDRLARRNQELAAANVELKHLDEIKSMFVSIAAHELRTPLAPILGYVELLLEEEMGALTNKQRESLVTVRRSVGRLVTITDNLLEVSRIEAGRIELILKPIDLGSLVAQVAAEFQPQLDVKSQKLHLSAALPLPLALCDEARAAQIVGNLVSNASRYSPPESEITLRLAPAQEEGFLQLSVIDHGAGISAQDQEKLFSQFFRTASASLSGSKGAGLGLYITRALVELHGGRIWLESEPGRGSSFHVTFHTAGGPVTGLDSA